MNLISKRVYRKMLGLLIIGILITNFSLLVWNIEPILASPELTLKWSKDLGYYAKTYIAPLAADVNNDGKLEIIVTGGSSDPGTDGTVTALNGETGDIVWQVTPGGIGMHSPCEIADINNDGDLEIVVSGSNPVVLHGKNGTTYWRNTAVSSYNLYSPVYDIDGDGYYEIFVSSGYGPVRGYDYFTVLSYDGEILLQNPTSWHPCWGGLTIGDANFDGIFELYQGDRRYGYSLDSPYVLGEWGVRALDAHTLTPMWNDSDITASSHTPILADVDNDGMLDVVAMHQSSTNGGLVVLNATDGQVLTTGGKYRKNLGLGLSTHSQPTVYDIDGDGNLEIITSKRSNPKIWDLYDWKLDATLPIVCVEPPKVGDVTGDGIMDIIAVTTSTPYVYIYTYDNVTKDYIQIEILEDLPQTNAFTLVEDVDDDDLNELILTSSNGFVYCYDTPASPPTPRVRQGVQFYGEHHWGAAEYVSPPGPPAPQISEPSPPNGATDIPITLSQLSFKLTDYQHNPINYTVTTTPDIGSGDGVNVPNGDYTVPISNLHYSTTHTWIVNATDGTNTSIETFTFITENPPPWWNIDWQHRREITIDHNKVPTDQTNFPVLIDFTDSSLTTKAQSDGDDFVFTDANHHKLNHEIELYENVTGHLVAWVNVPLLLSTIDTILHMYYGNPAAGNQQNISATWDTSHKMVLHLDEKTGVHYDSTINNNNGTPYNGVVQDASGKIDGADNFDGTNDYVEVPHSNTLAGYTEAFTLSLWLKLDDVSRRQTILNKYNTADNQRGWLVDWQPSFASVGEVLGFFVSQDGVTYSDWYASFDPTLGTWYYITIVWETGKVPKFYVNGVQVATINSYTTTSISNNSGTPLHIGRSTYATGRYMQGSLDEIRISNPARSTDYILTCHNNQENPSTFYTIGAEETFEEPSPPVVSDPYPTDNAMGINLNPVLSVNATDYQGDLMTIIFSTNASGTWQNIGSYTSIGNGVYNQTTTNMNNYDTTYCWEVQVTDGTDWTNRTYSFTTRLAPSTWWDTHWQYRRVITIDPSKVSSDQTDFPVVIDLTDSGLTSKAQVDGDDFVFTDEDNVKLNHEIEVYDNTTGHLIAWINVPYLSSTIETILYMYYGNPVASNQQNPMAVWDTSHKLVLHLSETHECRMWGMIAESLPHDVVLDHLIYDSSSLKVLGGSNDDGWGLVYYNSSEPHVLRGPLPANVDPKFDLAANEMADSGAWIGVGHVRKRSQGAIPPEGNPHPFMRYKGGKWWAFEHNGNLNKDILKSLIGPEYLAANPPTVGTNWDDPDVVDSDLYGLYVLKCIEANNWNATLGIAQAVTDITELDSGAANFLLTNGEKLWGFRKGNTLSYYYQATPPQYSTVASQPPDPVEPGWVSLSDFNLITLTKNNPPSIITHIRQQYPLLIDSEFNDSVDSDDLRANAAEQDWYESREDVPTLLFLDESDVAGNIGKKAGFTANSSGNAYLSQEFSSTQTSTFSVQWDIYVDSILDVSPHRAGQMMIGTDGGSGPNRADGVRFVFLAFNKTGGAESGTADLVAMLDFNTQVLVASDLKLDQWYTIEVAVNVTGGTYDVYVDGVYEGTFDACTALSSVTHISFAQWNDGAGAFYVDNVFSPTADRYKLTITTEGNGSVTVDPAESSYLNGTKVTLTAAPESSWMFSTWKGDASGNANPITITMDGYKTVIANFTQALLVDSEFNDSVDSADLRADATGQDWYESRANGPTILILNETDVGGNMGKKAGFAEGTSSNSYVSQEFSSAQTGVFSFQWDIFVDSIADIGDPDRTGWMMIGDDSSGTDGPNYPGGERFVLMAFFKNGGGTSGAMDLVVRERGAGWSAFTTVVSGLSLKQWYTIKVVCNLDADTYDVYVDGEYKATVTSYATKTSVTHISFAQWNDGAGAFCVDNVFAPAVDRFKLTMNVIGNGSVTVDPGESTYAVGTEVNLTAIADSGWVFSSWSGDLSGSANPTTITMDSNKTITATFTKPEYTLTINIVGSGSVTKNPDKSTYDYGESVNLTASPGIGWSFLGWSGDLSGSDNPDTIIMDGNKVVVARFIQEGTCIDSTVNGNDGILYGGITQGAPGKIDGAYEFDGFDDYIEVPHSDTLTGFTEAFTASFWLKLQDTTRRQTILNKYDTAGNQRGWFIEYQDHVTQGKVLGFFASQNGATYNEWYASFNPTAGTWNYITIIWETNTVPKFYINGVQVATIGTSTLESIFNNVDAPLHIGRSTYATGRYLQGSLDEIRLSNPTRSVDYILACYNNQKDPSTFYEAGLEETLPTEPIISDPYPTDEATNIPITLAELNFTLSDYQSDLMDYYLATYPDIGSDSATGVGDGSYSVATSGLEYQTTYIWSVNVTDGAEWTNRTFTFTTRSELLADSEFSASSNSTDLRANSPEQDWYESRAPWSGSDPDLLYLDESDIGGNTGKKAGFTASTSGNAYCSQEFSSPQTEVFSAQWDIYVDSIINIGSPDRAGIMLIGSDLDGQKGPSSTDSERFVFLAFYKDGGATSGTADLVAMYSFSSFETIASGLNLDQWYTIKVLVNVSAYTYDIYLDDVYQYTMEALTPLSTVTHIGFAQWNDGAGAFYVDNVFASSLYTLNINIVGSGSVEKDPDQTTYTYGTEVTLNATADPSWTFTGWSGDISTTDNPTTITMDGDKTVTATFTAEANVAPEVSNPQPANETSGVPVSTPLLNFTLSDGNADFMDYYASTNPDIGSDSALGVSDGTYSLPVSGLACDTTYSWWVNVTDGTDWTNSSFTFTTESPLLVDSEFDDSVDSADLRDDNATAQDWYESRGNVPALLVLNATDVGGNSGKKAGFVASSGGNAYVSQEFSSAQTGVFSVQWDIYIDSIIDISAPDRAGWMLIGDDTYSGNGPNADNSERFVYMTFYKPGGGTEGTMDLVARDRDDGWTSFTTIASGLNMHQWYTINVVCNLTSDTYNVYVDGEFKATVTSRMVKGSVSHISFAQWNDGAGAFCVDNVFAPATDRYKLTVNTFGNGSVTINPGESSYASGSEVELTATPDSGWEFSAWSGDLTSTSSPVNITMNSDKTVTANFTEIPNAPPVVSNPEPADAATGVLVSTSLLNFTLSDANADSMDYYVSTLPDVGSDSALGKADGTYNLTVSGLDYGTAYSWWVNVTDGTDWTNTTYTFTTEEILLVDPEFNDSVDSADLRANNATAQDWYESRAHVPTLLFLDETDVGGNTGKKAGFTASSGGNAYCTQEFSSAQSGTFTVQWDIYVDSILAISGLDRAGFMLIGADLDASGGPNRVDGERFVYMAFLKDGGATSGPADLVAMSSFSSYTTVASGLNLDQWHTIKAVVYVATGTYDVYVNGAFAANVAACTALSSVTHISFAQWNDGAGAFYVDNVFSPPQDRYKLTVNLDGSGTVTINPGDSSYANGTEVTLNATADPSWTFTGWSGDISTTDNPTNVTMNADKNVTAVFTAEANVPPEVSDPEPADEATGVPVSTSLLNFTLSDGNADSMDYYVSTAPDVGSDSALGASDGTYSLSVSDMDYGTAYSWWVNVTDGTDWTNSSFTFTTEELLLVDSEFNDSVDSADLRDDNATVQDWYESREDDPTLLTLNVTNVGGNAGKKAEFTGSASGNAYLSQEFSSPQTSVFTVQWDIYVDSILNIGDPDRTGWMLIGDETHVTSPGPNSNNAERFVYMAFYKPGGGTEGTMDLVARDRDDGWTSFTTVASGLNLKQWCTIKVVCDLDADTYDIYVDGVYQVTVTSRIAKTSVTHISFAQWNDGAGTFYVDNVFAPAQDRYKLTINVEGNGSASIDPSESTYTEDTMVTLTAVADSGWMFSEWKGDAPGSDNPTTITMNGDKTIIANFTEILLLDSEFNNSTDSVDLRADNATAQDWYESRNDDPSLLVLNNTDVGGNTGKKAEFIGDSTGNAYVSQEFSSAQTGTFSVQWDIYVDSILDISGNPDRAGWMLIGDESHVSSPGPNSNNVERFVYMAFFKDGGGTSGTMDLVARDRDDGWTAFTTVASGLNLSQWYTIKVVCDLDADTYDVYVDGVYKATVTSRIVKTSVTHISFAQWNDGAGTFYVDNVFAPARDASLPLSSAHPNLTSPSGDYRWMDVANQTYSSEYMNNYNYSQAGVAVTYNQVGSILTGKLVATNLKPNFAYQLKLVGAPGTDENERIGFAGRWWQEIWNGTAWADGWNLNDKGDGSSPNPNDDTYIARRYIENSSSPTGYHYRYTGYLLFGYFITDDSGNAELYFETDNCYHVLWQTTQRTHNITCDGPLKTVTFDPDPAEYAYDFDYSNSTITIFGEWERLPMGETHLPAGLYNCQIVLTEESFHGNEPLEGNWASAMSANISFTLID